MGDHIDQLLSVCSDAEKDELEVLNSAVQQNLEAYKVEKSAAKLKDWRDAKRALQETVDMMMAKYFDDEEPFKSRIEVVHFLQSEGYKIKKSKLYHDAEKGLLRVQPGGTVKQSDVRDYALVAGLKKVEDKNGKLSDEQAEKIKHENNKLKLTNEKLQFELDQLHQKYLLKTDVQTEIAIKIGAFESGFKHMVRMKAADWIYAVGGVPEKTNVLSDLIYAGIDDLLNEFGNLDELSVTIRKQGH